MTKRLRSINDVSSETDDYRRGFTEGEEFGYNNAVQSFSNNTKKNTDGAELEEVLNRNVQLREENQKLNEAQISLQTEFIKRTSNFDSTIATLNSRLETYMVDIDKLQNQLETYRVDIDTRNARSNKLDEELKEIKKLALKNTVEWQGQLQKKETEYATLKKLNDVIAQEKAELTENSKRTNIELQNQVSTRTTEILNLTTNNDNLRKTLQTLEAENTRLDKLQASHAAQLQELQASYNKKLTETIEYYDSEKQSDSQKISQLEADITKKIQQLDQQQNELGQFNIQFTQLQTSNAEQVRAAAENERLQRELQNQIQSLLQQLQTSQAAQAQAATENEKQFTKLQQDAAENEGRLLQEYTEKIADITHNKNKQLQELQLSQAAQAQAAAEKEKQLFQENKREIYNITQIHFNQIQSANQQNQQQQEKIIEITSNKDQLLIINNDLRQEIDTLNNQLSQNEENYRQSLFSQQQQIEENYRQSLFSQQQQNIEEYDQLLKQQKAQQDIEYNRQLDELKFSNSNLITQLEASEKKVRKIEEASEAALAKSNADLKAAEEALSEMRIELAWCKTALKAGETELAKTKAAGEAALAEIKAALAKAETELVNNKAASEKAMASIKAALAASESKAIEAERKVESIKAALDKNKTALAASEAKAQKIKLALAESEAALAETKKTLAENNAAGKAALTKGETELNESKLELNSAKTELANNKAANETAMANLKAKLEASEAKETEAEKKIKGMEAELIASNAKTKEIELELAESKRNAALNLTKISDLERINIEVNSENIAQSKKIESLNQILKNTQEELSNQILMKEFYEGESEGKEKLTEEVKTCELEKRKCLDEQQKLQQTAQDNVNNLNSITAEAEKFFEQANEAKRDAKLNSQVAEIYIRKAEETLKNAKDKANQILEYADKAKDETIEAANRKATEIVTEATNAATTKITEAAKTANQLLEESKNNAQIITNSIENLIAEAQKEIRDAKNLSQEEISKAKKLSQIDIKETEDYSEKLLITRASEILDNARKEAQSIIDVNKDLTEENKKLSQSNSSIGETLTALTTKKNELDATLAAIKIEVEQYENEKKKIKDLSTNISQLRYGVERLDGDTKTKTFFLQTVTQKFNDKKTEYDNLKLEIAESNLKLEKIDLENSILTKNLSQKKFSLDSIEKKIKEKEKIEKEFKDFTKELDELNKNLTESKQKLNDFENSEQFKNYNTNLLEVTELKKTNESLNENYNDLNEKLNDKIEEIKNLDSGKKILKASIKENEQSLSTVKDTLEKTQTELNNIQKDLIDAYNLNESLSKENNELREKIDARNLGAAQAIEEMQKKAAQENAIVLNDFDEKKQKAEKALAVLEGKKLSKTEEITKASIEIANKVKAADLKIINDAEAANNEIAVKKEEANNEIKKLKEDFAKKQKDLEQEKSELQIKKNRIDAVISKQKEFEDKIKSLQTEIESETENETQLKKSIEFLKEKKKKHDLAKYLEENEFALDFRTKIATYPRQIIQLKEENRKYQADNIILTKKLQKLLQIKEFVESFNTGNDIQNFNNNLDNLKNDFDLFSRDNPEVVRSEGEYSNDIELYLNNIRGYTQTNEQTINNIIFQLQKKYKEFETFIEKINSNVQYNQQMNLNDVLQNFKHLNENLIKLQLEIKDALLNVIITSSGKEIGDDIINLLKKYEPTYKNVDNCLLKLKNIEDNVDTLYKTIFGNDGKYSNPNLVNELITITNISKKNGGNPENKETTLNNINIFFETLFLEIKNNPTIFKNVEQNKKKLTLNALITNYKELVEFKKNIDQVTKALKSEHNEALKALKEENEKKIIEDKQRITELTNENEKLITENTQINNFYDNNHEKIEKELEKLRNTTTKTYLEIFTNVYLKFSTDKSKYVDEIPEILEKINKIIETYNEKIEALANENNKNKENIIRYNQKNTELISTLYKYNEIVKRNYSNIETNLKEIPQYLLINDNDLLKSAIDLFVGTPTIESLATNVTQDTFIDIISKIMPLITETLKKNKENIEENDAKIKQFEEENNILELTKSNKIQEIKELLKKEDNLNNELTKVKETLTKNKELLESTKITVNDLTENNKALSTQNQKYLAAIVENARLLFSENKKINRNNTNNVIDDTKLSNENAVDYLKEIAQLLENSLTQLIKDKEELQTKYEEAKIAEDNARERGDRINDSMATFTKTKKKEEQSKTDKIYDLVKTLVVSNAIHGGNSYDINSKLSIYNNSKDLDTLIQILEFLTKNTVLYQTELLEKLKVASRPIDSTNYTKLYKQLEIKDKYYGGQMEWFEKGGSEIDKNIMIIKQKIQDYEEFIEEICMIRENSNIYGEVGNLAITNNTYFQDFLNYLIGNIKNWLDEKIDYQNDKEKFLEKENKKRKKILSILQKETNIAQNLKKIVDESDIKEEKKNEYNNEYNNYESIQNYKIMQTKLDKEIKNTLSWKTKDETELKNKTEETLKLKTELLEKKEKETKLTEIITKKDNQNKRFKIIIASKDSIISQQSNEITTLLEEIKNKGVTPQDYDEVTAKITQKNAEIQANAEQVIAEKKEMQEKYNKLEEENSKLKENIKSNEQNVIKNNETIEKIKETLNMKIKENSDLQLKLTNAGSGGTPGSTPIGTPVVTPVAPQVQQIQVQQIKEIEKILQIQQQQYADTSNEIQFSIRNFQELMLEKEYEAEQQKRRESIKILKGSTLKKITESITKPKKDAKQETRNLSKALAMLGKATSDLSDSNRKTKEALAKRKTATSMR